jgi:hypothetical protein
VTVKWKGNHVFQQLNLPDEKKLNFGNGDDVQIYWHSGQLVVYASTDDTVLEVGYSGSAQKSFDIILYGNAAGGADQVKWDASASKLSLVGAAEVELGRHVNVIMWKGTSYTVLAADTGKIISTTSANAAVVYTLPVKASGLNYKFFNVANQNMTIQLASGSVNEVVAYNDAAADSIAFSTSGRKIGAAVELICDGKVWYAIPQCSVTGLSNEGHLVTIGT